MNTHNTRNRLRSAALLLGMLLALPLSLYVPQANASISQVPLFLTNPVPPFAILNMSRSHQLFFKAYTDYSDLNGDGVPELTYTHSIDYYGYFDPDKCYVYSTTDTRFVPSYETTDKYCTTTDASWSGNFLNWVTMSRMDIVRKLLYGGKRVVDTASLTVLERALLPNDAHSWAKYYNGDDIKKLTPFDPLTGESYSSVASVTSVTLPTSFPDKGGRAKFIKFDVANNSDFAPGDQVLAVPVASPDDYMIGGVSAPEIGGVTDVIEIRVEKGIASVSGSGTYNAWKLVNLSSTGISFCNTTYADSGDSQTVTAPPLIRTVAGNFALWSANEATQCLWYDERNNKQSGFDGGFRTNGNRASFSGLKASAENPDKEEHGLGKIEYVVQVEACVTGLIGSEDCKKYPNGNYKPTGLLQEFGDEDQIYFGLFTGSYNNNISGGVLRKNISAFSNEVNVDTNGTFTSVDGIVATLDKIQMYGYRYGTGDHYGVGDNCSYQLTDITEGDCRSWGNPMSEIYVESLRYLAGQSPTDDFTPANQVLGLTVASWNDPLNDKNYCAPLNVLNFNASVSTYDNNQVDTAFATLSATKTATELTNELGALEGINGANWFVGNTSGQSNDLCSAKTVTGLGNIYGICPAAPASEGTYRMAGAAWWANTNKIRSDITIPAEANEETAASALEVTTYGVALAMNVPQVQIPVPNTDKTVTLLPSYRLDISSDGSGPFGAGGLVDFKIVVPYTVSGGVGTGSFYVNWEDSEQGGDYDQDMWGVISYRVTQTTIEVTTNAVSASTENGQGFGYIISGTTEDGPHFHSGIYKFDYTDPYNISVTPTTNLNASGGCSDCELSDLPTTATYQIGSTSAGLLKNPLWYTAKYGGFNDTNNNGEPDLQTEWDEDADGTPDTFFFATNPLELEASLRKAFLGVLGEEASAASVATNSTRLDTNTVIYQARFESEDWSGQVLAYDLDPTDGSVGSVLWDASKLMPTPAARNIFTWNPDASPSPTGIDFFWGVLSTAQQLALNTKPDGITVDTLGEERLNWIRGDGSNELANGGVFRSRHVRDGQRIYLGDIVNSDPIFVGTPDFRYGVLTEGQAGVYDTFLTSIENRSEAIYIGANDGMLHAFDADTGVEMFAYIPSILFDKLSALPAPTYADDTNGNHQYYVDTTARAGDAFFSSTWHTVLVGGLGAGGRAIFALDITDPDTFDETDIMWEFTPAQDDDAGDLGYTIGQPTIARLANDKWVAMFGNGYASPNGDAILYILDLETGAIIEKITVDNDVDDDGTVAINNGLSSVIPIDVNSDRITDYVYAGDLKGNMWKFDLTSTTSSQWDVAWTQGQDSYPLFTASGPSSEVQPITHRPQVGFGPGGEGGYMVYFGTGKYFETTDNDIPTSPAVFDVQSFYGIHDSERTTDNAVPTRSNLVEQTILFEGAVNVQAGTPVDANIRVVSDNTVDYSSKEGWYIDLVSPVEDKQGERVVSNPLLRSNRIIFTTLIPTESPCGFGGTGWLMEMDAFSGARLTESVFDLNDDGAFTDDDYVTVTLPDGSTIQVPASGRQSQVGIISTPGIVSAGDKELKYLSGSSGEIEVVKEKSSGSGGRKSWRQIR